ncbi:MULTISPECIES: hypothetical protein [unclassified Streptomyces]|uniref:hypothetical protein n=1 Tax=unclassified Streptomyces TaxID=2593676 RepID=UPI0008238491|nr:MULTISPECIES: hypothetical protein [unclassified Streptomyces]MYT99996.1 hypothetical protein [Streptomyces sp. SID8350]SCK62570.1 hypothetical protein YUWDRAFT_06530 [Streptomyces sp. AmelKG-D3]
MPIAMLVRGVFAHFARKPITSRWHHNHMKLSLRVTLWVYIAFNVVQTAVLSLAPEMVDSAYRGGEMTPTRHFMWFAIAGYHVLIIAVTVVAMGLGRAADRRKIIVINALMYIFWDAMAQIVHWGHAIGMTVSDLSVNSGVSLAVGLMLLVVAWLDRDTDASPRNGRRDGVDRSR